MLAKLLKEYNIILASASPRRQQFFKDLGLPFKIILKPVEETYPTALQGCQISDYLAQLKAEVFKGQLLEKDILITSDTIVWHDGKVLGKPANKAAAVSYIQSLSGSTHQVITSVCFTTSSLQKTVNNTTYVTFKPLHLDEINYYVDNFMPLDKAGAYGIQEWIGYIGVTHIEGSYFNVMGLPVHLVYETLKSMVIFQNK